MNTGITDLVFILDRSGSMAGLERDTIGGFNSMLERQRREAGRCRVTTVLFDHQYQLVHDHAPVESVSPMDETTYFARGSTALMDAVGFTIQRMVQAQRTAPAAQRAERVMFVIITDGFENASRTFTQAQVRRMIREERLGYDWEFIFLGANIEAGDTAEAMGIDRDRAVNYCADAAGTRLNFEAVSDAACCVRACRPMGDAWRGRIDADFRARGRR